jgi:hypothetical protein
LLKKPIIVLSALALILVAGAVTVFPHEQNALIINEEEDKSIVVTQDTVLFLANRNLGLQQLSIMVTEEYCNTTATGTFYSTRTQTGL